MGTTMAEGRPEEPPDPNIPKTFRDAVDQGKKTTVEISFADVKKVPPSTFKGEPALIMTEEEEDQLAEEYQFTLVGKFSWGRPAMTALRKEILNAAFHGEVYVGLLDSRHVVFNFEQEADFQRMWLRKVWYFAGFQARLFRWTKEFRPDVEPSIAPVWIRFPMLPLHLFKPEKLYTLASVVGKPLKLDTATASGKHLIRPSEARVCVEMDVLKPSPERVWIGSKEKGAWQKIEIEERPSYCTKCKKLGHRMEECQPQIRPQTRNTQLLPTTQKKAQNEWQVVTRTRKLQIREVGNEQANHGSMGNLKGSDIEKARMDKGKGKVPGSSPQICEVEEQGGEENDSTEKEMNKDGLGPSCATCEGEPQQQGKEFKDSTEENQIPGNVKEANSMLDPKQGESQDNVDRGNHTQLGTTPDINVKGSTPDVNKKEEEGKEQEYDPQNMPLATAEKEKNVQEMEEEALALVVYEKEQDHSQEKPEEVLIVDLNMPTGEETKSQHNSQEEKAPKIHKVASESKLEELTTDSEGETLVIEEQQFSRLAEGEEQQFSRLAAKKEGAVDTRLKSLTEGKKYSASGSKTKTNVDSKMTLRQKGTKTGPRLLTK